MAEQSTTRHLRVVRVARRAQDVEDARREAYWARLNALRAERQRLRVG